VLAGGIPIFVSTRRLKSDITNPRLLQRASAIRQRFFRTFTVTNNINSSQYIYFFVVDLPARNITNVPSAWDPNVWPSWDNLGFTEGLLGNCVCVFVLR